MASLEIFNNRADGLFSDHTAFRAEAKKLICEINTSIDRLALYKDSTAYTFESSLSAAVNAYYDAAERAQKENKSLDFS
jgi:hypothetical protein